MGPITRSQSYSSVASSPASPPAVPRPPPRPSLNRQSTASNTSTISTDSNTSTRPTVAFVHGLPKEFQTPKSFSTIAKNIPKLYSTISTVTFYKGGVAKVTSFDRELPKNLSKLSHQVGKPLTIESKASSTTPPPQQTTRPSFSCVVVGVEHDISESEIAEYLSSKKIPFRRVLRITSARTNRPTMLIRIITHDPNTLQILFSEGITLYSHVYRVEASNDRKVNPTQCTKCHSFEHPSTSCPSNTPVCGRCGGAHPTTNCKPSLPAKCCNCGGRHVAFSMACPERPKTPTSAETTAKLKYADVLIVADAPPPPPPPAEHTFIRLFTISLLNLFPDRRPVVESVIFPLIRFFYNVQPKASYSGNYINITLVPCQ